MFGLLRGCYVDKTHKEDWVSHYCGLCMSLSKTFGSMARIFTNSDAVLLSMLYEAQCNQYIERSRHYCFLRGGRQVPIVSPSNPGSTYAAVVSSFIASSKIIDHVVDGDSWIKYFPKQFLKIGSHISRTATRVASGMNVDTEGISDQLFNQSKVEQEDGLDFLAYSHPIETATSIACSATAMLAERPENSAMLSTVGRMYGRIIYVLDSYEDYGADLKNDRFNPLAQGSIGLSIRTRAKEIFDAAYGGLRDSLKKVQFVHPEPCRTLLLGNLRAVASEILDEPVSEDGAVGEDNKESSKAKRRGCFGWDCFGADCCCDVCSCDAWCCEVDCCCD